MPTMVCTTVKTFIFTDHSKSFVESKYVSILNIHLKDTIDSPTNLCNFRHGQSPPQVYTTNYTPGNEHVNFNMLKIK
jgi:hypothetical protein